MCQSEEAGLPKKVNQPHFILTETVILKRSEQILLVNLENIILLQNKKLESLFEHRSKKAWHWSLISLLSHTGYLEA